MRRREQIVIGADIARKWLRFNKEVFATLADKCERETKVGKIANALLMLVFVLLRKLKSMRQAYQVNIGTSSIFFWIKKRFALHSKLQA